MATIDGTLLDDVLYDLPGLDKISGLAGNDLIIVEAGADHGVGETVDGGAGYDRLWFASGAGGDTLVLQATVTGIEEVQIGDAVGNTDGTLALDVDASRVTTGLVLVGNAGDNAITGTARDDEIRGNGGADTLLGGAGNDDIFVRVDAPETANAGLQAEGNTLTLIGTAAGAVAVDLTAGDQIVSLGGVADAAVQQGFSHVDASSMAGAAIAVKGSALKNLIVATALADTLEGGGAGDLIVAGAGDDILIAGAAAEAVGDTVLGGDGDDVLRFTAASGPQTLVLGANMTGVETVEVADAAGDRSGTAALSVNAAGVKSALMLRGNDGDNSLTGTALADTLSGGGGTDVLAGGAGDDLYLFALGADATATERISDAVGKSDTVAFQSVVASDTLVLGRGVSGIERVRIDSAGTALNVDASAVRNGLEMAGNDAANSITGTAGKDTIVGGGGADTLNGGAGADTITVDLAQTAVVNAGLATEGNTLLLVRNTGYDPASGDPEPAVITVQVDLSGAVDPDQIRSVDGVSDLGVLQTGFTHVDGTNAEYTSLELTGSAAANLLVGTSHDDTIQGGGGADSLSGGTGNDVFLVGSTTEMPGSERLDAGDGTDVLRFTSITANQTLVLGKLVTGLESAEIADPGGDTTGTTRLGINASGLASAIKLVGNDGANALTGTNGDDTLNGNAGDDVLQGGAGNDTYLVDAGSDVTAADRIADAAGGMDTLEFAPAIVGDALVLGRSVTGIEKFVISGTNAASLNAALVPAGASFLGNDADNAITGTAKGDTIEGGAGTDSITGGAGNDRIVVALDSIDEVDAGLVAEGNTLVLTGAATDVLYVDLSQVNPGDDQFLLIGATAEGRVQSGFTHVDASGVTGFGIDVVGSNKANHIVGTDQDDVFEPGRGADTIEGGGAPDSWVIHSQADYDGDIYTDKGSDANDYMYFDGTDGQTLVIRNNVSGVDVAAAGLFRADTTRLNINAAAVDHPFGLAGNAGDNILTATRNGESLFDYGGNDKMYGGGGDDDYVIMRVDFWTPLDVISDSSGTDDLYFTDPADGVVMVVGNQVRGIERFVVSGSALATGGDYRRDITTTNSAGIDASLVAGPILMAGNDGGNYLAATTKNDTIIGYGGNDTVYGGAGNDLIETQVDGASLDEIHAGAATEGNRLVLNGTLAGTMVIDLSAADQIVSVAGVAEVLAQDGINHVDASAVLGFSASLTGNGLANNLVGTIKDDTLAGGAGADTLVGGGGNDVFIVGPLAEFPGNESVAGGDGTDLLQFDSNVAGQTLVLSGARVADVEAVEITGLVALNVNAAGLKNAVAITGNDQANSLTATPYADTLTGGGGADTLTGGAGNDVYLIGDAADFAVGERIGDSAGTADRIRFDSSVAADELVLGATVTGIEVVELVENINPLASVAMNLDASALASGITVIGNAAANRIIGTARNDTLEGKAGTDTLIGGLGTDVFRCVVDQVDRDDVSAGARSEGNKLVLTGTTGGHIVMDLSSDTDQWVSVGGVDDGHVMTGITHVDASAVQGTSITLTGSAEANTLIGTEEDDFFVVLDALHFNGDKLDGDDGADTLRFASTTSGQVLTLNGLSVTHIEKVAIASATGDASGVTTLGINAASVKSALVMDGNAGDNALTGTAYADTLTGGDGHDTIVAGGGADRVVMDIAAASIDAADGGGLGDGNELVLSGAAAGALAMDLGAADQITSVGGIAESLRQAGFLHVDASSVTTTLSIVGSTGANRILGGSADDSLDGGGGNDTLTGGDGQDTVLGGLGMDSISMSIEAGDRDQASGGADSEGNSLLLTGTAAGTVVLDLGASSDQLVSIGGIAEALAQTGFASVDASAMGGAAVSVTGSALGNVLRGTSMADTLDGGGGADRIYLVVGGGAYDQLDGGNGNEGDTLVLVGSPNGELVVDLGAAPGTDQFLSENGVAEGITQSDFQHVDASGITGISGSDPGLTVFGNGADNVLLGTLGADTFVGRAGADSINMGGTYDSVAKKWTGDSATDLVVYVGPDDGWNTTGVAFSYDRISAFEANKDVVAFTTEFNGGTWDLDDISADDSFAFASNAHADFTSTDEALLVSLDAKVKAAVLTQSGFGSVVAAINKLGVTAAAGDDGLIVVRAGDSTGIYYYEESDGRANNVSGNELTLLGVADANLGESDFVFG